MFRIDLRRHGVVTALAAWAALAAVACNGEVLNANVADASTDGGIDEATPVDRGIDAGPEVTDAGGEDSDASDASDPLGPMVCTGSGILPILGNYVASDGSQHWLRKTATATTYARIPAGAATHDNPPVLWKIVHVCADQTAFVAMSETSTYARVEWNESAQGLSVCVAIENAADSAAALAVPRPVPASPTGCNGGPWTSLTAKDGGT